jgi:hypothetical protein
VERDFAAADEDRVCCTGIGCVCALCVRACVVLLWLEVVDSVENSIMCSCRLRPEDLTGLGWWQEVLDQQFTQLQQLQDESNPEFVLEVVSLFFEDSERLLEELTEFL